jgi:hypothetical protein
VSVYTYEGEKRALFDNLESRTQQQRLRDRHGKRGQEEVITMPIDPVKRLENWDKKYNLERINAILVEKRPKMLEHVTSAIVSLSSMETQVKQVLDSEGAGMIQYPFYLCFGRELWSMTHEREVSGEAAAVAAAVLVSKWTARGLGQAVLETIRTQVFNIGRPTTPGP